MILKIGQTENRTEGVHNKDFIPTDIIFDLFGSTLCH